MAVAQERKPLVEVPARYAAGLPAYDRVEILLLGEQQEEAEKNTLAVPPDGLHAPILKRKELKGAEATRLCELWRGLSFDLWAQALCHIPGYALRFYKDGKVEFETSVCFMCSNFSYPKPPKGRSLHGFSMKDPAGQALRDFLTNTLPLELGKQDQK